MEDFDPADADLAMDEIFGDEADAACPGSPQLVPGGLQPSHDAGPVGGLASSSAGHPAPAGPAAPMSPHASVAASAAGSVAFDGREAALATVKFPNGHISYYKDDRFQAVCCCCAQKGEKLCRQTRSSKPNKSKLAQGRPLGLMAAWMLAGPAVHDRETHCDRMLVRLAYSRLTDGQLALSFERCRVGLACCSVNESRERS